jgi:hypothetical protein
LEGLSERFFPFRVRTPNTESRNVTARINSEKRRDDVPLAQILKEPRKHLFRIDAVVEAGAPSLDRAGDIVKRRTCDSGISFVFDFIACG